MVNVYSCSCVSDSMFGLSFDEIKKMVTCPSDLSVHVITIDETPENFYICCRRSIIFCYLFNRNYLYYQKCDCNGVVTCFNLMSLDLTSKFCQHCKLGLKKFLFNHLVKII